MRLQVRPDKVSRDNPDRDTNEKRADYAEARIPEYWIVDPEDGTISVLRLEGGRYVEHGVLPRGSSAASALLNGFEVSVDAVLDSRKARVPNRRDSDTLKLTEFLPVLRKRCALRI